jgi:hypothetical protein
MSAGKRMVKTQGKKMDNAKHVVMKVRKGLNIR